MCTTPDYLLSGVCITPNYMLGDACITPGYMSVECFKELHKRLIFIASPQLFHRLYIDTANFTCFGNQLMENIR